VERNARVAELAPLSPDTHAALKAVYRGKIEQLVRSPI
jgi:hypothetical protein